MGVFGNVNQGAEMPTGRLISQRQAVVMVQALLCDAKE